MFARRILVVEDEALLRDLLVETCERRGFLARGAGTASDALDAIGEFDPDLVVLDIDLGGGPSGFDIGLEIEMHRPDIGRLYLTRFADRRAAGFTQAPRGRVGYLHKNSISSLETLMTAVESMFDDKTRPPRDDLDKSQPLASLSDAQVEVLKLASEGLSNQAIARVRGTSESAVESLFTGVFRVLEIERSEGVNRRAMAIKNFVDVCGAPLSN